MPGLTLPGVAEHLYGARSTQVSTNRSIFEMNISTYIVEYSNKRYLCKVNPETADNGDKL